MSSPRCLQLLLSCILLVLLVQFPRAQSRPATEDTEDTEDKALAPQWVWPEKMEKSFLAVLTGRVAKLRCAATGNPVPSLRWYKNGEEVSNVQRQGGFKIRNHTWTLKMESVVPSDRGDYTCVVKNKHGSLKHTYHLDVIERCYYSPVLVEVLPADQTAVVGGDVTFVCKVQSGLQPHVQWLKHITINGSTAGPDGLPYVRVLQTSGGSTDGVTYVLTLRNVTLNDAGEYTCLGANSMGSTYRTAQLTVEPKPEPEPQRDLLYQWLHHLR